MIFNNNLYIHVQVFLLYKLDTLAYKQLCQKLEAKTRR